MCYELPGLPYHFSEPSAAPEMKAKNVYLCPSPIIHISECCNVTLLKTVEVASGKKLLYPHITYCYLSIKTPLQSLRPSFINECEKWRSRSVQPNTYYDGQVWNDFWTAFLADPLSFTFTINLDCHSNILNTRLVPYT